MEAKGLPPEAQWRAPENADMPSALGERNMADIVVRLAKHEDHEDLASLMIEMQRHYGAQHPTHDELKAQLASLPDGVQIFVAEAGGRLVGLAATANVYPGPGISAGFFLKELYVTNGFRGAGAGRALMHEVARAAVSKGFGRIDWTVGRSNASAVTFYTGLGADPDPERLFFRLSGAELMKLADAG